MHKPSYLFGTMHVKDKRVFNFSDSVMLCIQNCSRFALEVHPDTAMIKMFDMLQRQDSLRDINKMFSKEEYDRLSKKFEAKNGYPLGKIDPMALESLMEPDEDKPDDKVSFVDAYLYGIARTMNKNIFGLEDAASQLEGYYGSSEVLKQRLLDLVDDDVEANMDKSEEEMVKIYSSGDINAVFKFADENGMLDSTIAARNMVMAASMIKYMADAPLFTAVGAAHLPGPDGVIALLKKAGYDVVPVPATFTGVANSFHIDYMKMDWPEHRDERLGYSLKFPGTPLHIDVHGLSTIIYPDLANNLYYGIYAIPRGTADEPITHQEAVNTFIKGLGVSKKSTLLKRKDFLLNKVPCTELLMKSSSEYIRLRLVLQNNLLYGYYVGSKVNHLNVPLADRFFNSFEYFPIPEKTASPWVLYTNKTGAFTIKLPEEPREMIKDIPAKVQSDSVSFKLNMYLSTDTANARSYVVRFNDYPNGTYLSDRDALFNSLITEFKGKGTIVAGPVKIEKDGFEGREVKAVLTGGFNAVIRLYVRGSRVYILVKEVGASELKGDNAANPFFSSFTFTPYTEPDYYTWQPDSGNFKIQMVAKPKVLIDSNKTYRRYLTNTVTCYATNPNSGGVYAFEHSKISPYYRVKSVDSLYKTLVTNLTTYRDSLIKLDTIVLNGIKGREMMVERKETHDKIRSRLIINGDDFFYMAGHLGNADSFDQASNVFFNSLTILRPSAKVDLASSKAEKIFRDLASSDSLTYQKAFGALAYYDFSKDELPFVYNALQKNYTDDTIRFGVRAKLIEKLLTVNNDSTISVLANLYPRLKGKDNLKGVVLNTIAGINKKNSYPVYLDLLTTDPPLKATNTYEIFSPLSDSVEFAAAHFEQLLPFIKDDKFRDNILRIARNMAAAKNNPYTKTLTDDYAKLTAYAQTDLDKYLALKESVGNDWSGLVYSYLHLMDKMKVKDINDRFTKKYLEKDPKGTYASDAVITRIYNGLPNNPVLVKRYLDSIGTRYDLMEAYDKEKQLDKVPLIYRKQEAFAKLCLYQYAAGNDDGSPDQIKLLGSITDKGNIYYVYKYSLSEGDEGEWLIGVAGPYKTGSTKLDFDKYHAYSDGSILQTDWRKQAKKMIKPLLDANKD